MAISDTEKLDFLWKKVIFGVSKTGLDYGRAADPHELVFPCHAECRVGQISHHGDIESGIVGPQLLERAPHPILELTRWHVGKQPHVKGEINGSRAVPQLAKVDGRNRRIKGRVPPLRQLCRELAKKPY